MSIKLAFDVYGTLINTQGVLELLTQQVGDQAGLFSRMWRDKQLEYSFRRGLMRDYKDFAICTRDAMEYCCASLNIKLSADQKNQLMASYRTLPAFDDVKTALEQAKNAGVQLYAFSNGNKDAVDGLLAHAGINQYFEDVISVDEIGTFKPNPDVYEHLLSRIQSTSKNCWLVSSNPFDVIGADNVGINTVWIKRSSDVAFDPWGVVPSITQTSLTGLAETVVNFSD